MIFSKNIENSFDRGSLSRRNCDYSEGRNEIVITRAAIIYRLHQTAFGIRIKA